MRKPIANFAQKSFCGLALAFLAASFLPGAAQAQLQTAGTVFVNVDATGMSAGALTDVTNSGTLGGYFESFGTGGLITNVSGVVGIQLNGANYLKLLSATNNGPPIAPPAGIVGSNATCSIEVWVLNPTVSGDESMVAWGLRTNGGNMAFEYGTGGLGINGAGTTMGGAQHFGSVAVDIPWDPIGGCPLNNVWHHLVYTYDGTNENLYADGVLVNFQPVTFNTVGGPSILLGAQWTAAGVVSSSPADATLTLARIRIHDNALTPAQVLNNFNFEKATFIAAAPTPQFLTAGPVHRYSFSEPATNNASGLTFHDSIGGADGIVQGNANEEAPQFTGQRLILPGGLNTSQPGYGAAYGDLPNGLFSTNSVTNGGTGELSIEIWYKNYAGGSWSSPRVFEAGSDGTGQTGVELTGPGGFVGGGLDYIDYAGMVGGSIFQRRLEWQNKDTAPSGSTTNATGVSADVFTMYSYQVDRHVVVTWKEGTSNVLAYENGILADSITVSNNMSALNDVNVWLGRSVNSTGDTGPAFEYDEVRFYTNVLTPGQVLGDFQTGPDTINTGTQAANILVQPQSTTNFQNFPVSFYVTASGSPAVSYQWKRNGTLIAGATGNKLNVASVALANNGDIYTCVVSNFANSTPNVVTSSSATLTVLPNVALPAAFLHETRDANPSVAIGSQRDNYSGVVGTSFTTGNAGAVVTHLGFYDVYGDGLNQNHNVGIFNSSGSTIIASVVVPNTVSDTNSITSYFTNGYRYMPLNPPVFLAPNTTYILEAETFNGDGDMWADLWTPSQWNTYFVGTNGGLTRFGRYGGPWPGGATALNGNNNSYGAPNLAVLPIGPPLAQVVPANLTNFAGQSATFTAVANGQAPLSLQWYQAPSTLLAGQTNATFTIPSVTVGNSGSYYVIASNGLGTNQSANATLTVLADTPVGITQQPVNVTVPEGYPASFTVVASGTTPITYQWNRNGSAIAGATNSSYSLTAAATNNHDLYSCIVSNFANSAPHTLTSSNATLTVLPNRAPVFQALHDTLDGNRNNYGGEVGEFFTVGAIDALVTHLGFYCTNVNGLNSTHDVNIWNSDGSVLIATVTVPSGTTALFSNSFAWVALNPPVVLTNGLTYILGAGVTSGDGDGWPDAFIPNWNPYFVGSTATTTRGARYGGSGVAPTGPSTGNGVYGAPNLALIPIGSPSVTLDGPTNVTTYVGLSASFAVLVDGQAPLTLQWYKEPSTLLTGQTNTTLTLSNLATGNSGNYYVIATNAQGSAQSSDAVLNVFVQSPPSISQQPQSQTVYIHQPAIFTVVAAGTPPLFYSWSFNATNIAGATNSTLIVSNVSAASAGNYQVTISNIFPPVTSSVPASLTVLTPPAGSYPAAAFNADPLVYYRFSETNFSPGNPTFNFGSLGAPYNGTYEGGAYSAPGPQPPDFPNFETTNTSVGMDGSDSDVSIPSFNFDTGTYPSVAITLLAWVYDNGPQYPYSGIIFHRGTDGAAGFGVTTDPSNGSDMLEYHWNNTYYTFVSSVDVPNLQWALAALVVQPNQATLYLETTNGLQSATNVAPHAAQTFTGVTYVGFDPNGGANSPQRRFNGAIDEAMVFGRALAPAEIGALYQAAFPAHVQLYLTVSGGNIILTWSNGTLQQSSRVTGTYTDLVGVTSPYTNAPTAAQQFFRVKVR
ncbi:MAG TPA: immunoglobulin domain-containing protein [Verrucomicrobiae bacterium]|nr:immunoglobulin domain-containing protein [Verrucomicrobiae bacterium]